MVVQASREADHLRTQLLGLLRSAMLPLQRDNVSRAGRAGGGAPAAGWGFLPCCRRCTHTCVCSPHTRSQVYQGNPDPNTVAPLALHAARMQAAARGSAGGNPYFVPFSQARSQ